MSINKRLREWTHKEPDKAAQEIEELRECENILRHAIILLIGVDYLIDIARGESAPVDERIKEAATKFAELALEFRFRQQT